MPALSKPSRPLTLFLLIGLVLGVYLPSLGFDFLNFDDNVYITLNPNMEKGISWEGIKWAWAPFGNFLDAYFMPLTWLSFLLDAQLFGIVPFGFHLTNMLLHLGNTLLVLYILVTATGRYRESFLIACLFAIHPQHVEAVAWIAERKEVLSAFLGLAAIAFYVNYAKAGTANRIIFISFDRYYLLAFLCYFLSMLAKPTMVTLPCLLLLLDWWPLGRLDRRTTAARVAEKLPFILLSVFLILVMLHSLDTGEAEMIGTNSLDLPLMQRVSNTFVIYTTYIADSFLPPAMPGWYPYPMEALPLWQTLPAPLALLAFTLFAISRRNTHPCILVGWCWFIGVLLPAASVGVYAIGDVFTADRWVYLPHIGFFIMLVWPLVSLERNHGGFTRPVTGLISGLVVVFCFLSFHQIQYWRDSESYWQRVLEKDDTMHFPNYMLGAHYRDTGQREKSIRHFRKSYEALPEEGFYIIELGNYHMSRNEPELAWDYYDRLLETEKVTDGLLVKAGFASMLQGRLEQAPPYFNKVLERYSEPPGHNPYYYQSYLYLAIIQVNMDDAETARESVKHYIREAPDRLELRCGNAMYLTMEMTRMGMPYDDIRASLGVIEEICDEKLALYANPGSGKQQAGH